MKRLLKKWFLGYGVWGFYKPINWTGRVLVDEKEMTAAQARQHSISTGLLYGYLRD